MIFRVSRPEDRLRSRARVVIFPDRFRSKHAYARFTGTAPIPVWSGNTVRVRLNRGGNRTVNTTLHMIAVTQVRGVGSGKSYADNLIGKGKTRTDLTWFKVTDLGGVHMG
jgi:transposase